MITAGSPAPTVRARSRSRMCAETSREVYKLVRIGETSIPAKTR